MNYLRISFYDSLLFKNTHHHDIFNSLPNMDPFVSVVILMLIYFYCILNYILKT